MSMQSQACAGGCARDRVSFRRLLFRNLRFLFDNRQIELLLLNN